MKSKLEALKAIKARGDSRVSSLLSQKSLNLWGRKRTLLKRLSGRVKPNHEAKYTGRRRQLIGYFTQLMRFFIDFGNYEKKSHAYSNFNH